MSSDQERILVVESDPEISDLIARQALQPLGYRVKVVETASDAIQQSMLFAPHLVVVDLDLPDLSGKDLLVALSSQGLKTPTIMIAAEGQESDVIQAFRLGATDYLRRPVREAELVSVVERALKQTRARREREQLARQLRSTNEELERRVRELTTIFAIGKAVTSITDQSSLFDRIVEGAVYITEAQRGWVLVRDRDGKNFILRAYRNLPRKLEMKLNQPWDDGVSSLVALSGEPLSIFGDPLKRFPIARLGQAALVMPIKVQGETIGLLVVLRNAANSFNKSDQTKLEAIADYASISLANAQLFRALEERARSLEHAMERAQRSEQSKDELIRNVSEELRRPLVSAKGYVDMLVDNQLGKLSGKQLKAIMVTAENLDRQLEIIESMSTMNQPSAPESLASINLNELIREWIGRYQHIAQQTGMALLAELPTNPVFAFADPNQVKQVMDGLITNAIKFSPHGGQITVRVDHTEDNFAHVAVMDKGVGIKEKDLAHVFDRYPQKGKVVTQEFSGLGLRLAFVKDIIAAHGGTVWAESLSGNGSAFHFTLLPPQ
jgi:signal transduction histidine kinase/FixJ family two-component response regulator